MHFPGCRTRSTRVYIIKPEGQHGLHGILCTFEGQNAAVRGSAGLIISTSRNVRGTRYTSSLWKRDVTQVKDEIIIPASLSKCNRVGAFISYNMSAILKGIGKAIKRMICLPQNPTNINCFLHVVRNESKMSAMTQKRKLTTYPPPRANERADSREHGTLTLVTHYLLKSSINDSCC